MKHTPTPWHAPGIGEICDQSGRVIAICIDCNPVEEALRPDPALEEGDANARRIVACVNACAGLDTAHIELSVESGVTVLDELNRIKAQRDELLAVLERIIGACDACMADDSKSLVDEFTEEMEAAARAAIQKVRGGE